MRTARAAGAGRVAATLGALLCCGALPPAAAAAQDPPRRVKIVRSDTTVIRSDSAFVRVTIDAGRIEQMIHELMASKAMEQQIGMALREASGQSADQKKVRDLSEELGRIAQKNASLITLIEMSCPGDRQPAGYLGVQFSELQTVTGDDAPPSASLRDYPTIDSVYPGSPASKAGVRRGDVVLAIGGEDSRRAVQLDKLLKPSAKLAVLVQRDGSPRELTIVVEKRPSDFQSECANVNRVIGPEFDQPMVFMRSRGQQAPAGAELRFPRLPAPTDAPPAPVPPLSGYLYGFSATNSAIAGATLMPLDDDWRAALGVDNGVLVTRVMPGTPAKDAGLHSSDVIISADGQSVSTVRALARIVGNARSNAVKLQVIRTGKAMALTLRWSDAPPPPQD